ATGHLARHDIDIEIGDAKPEHIHGATATEQRANSREQFLKGERLDQIVVGSAVEAAHAVFHGVASREQEDRSFKTSLADGREDLKAIAARQHQVEQDQV